MRKLNWTHLVASAGIVMALLVTAACSNGATVTVVASPSTTATLATTGTPSAPTGSNGTPISGPSATSCAAVLSNTGPASAGSNFTDLPLPANSVSTPVTATRGGGDGQFTIYEQDLCTTSTSPQTIFSFFANTLPGHNWPQQKWFPFDGYFYADCGDPFCWASGGSAPPRYVGLEAVTSHGSGIVSFHLRLATPPAAPTCDPSVPFPAGYYYNLQDLAKSTKPNAYQMVPLPPLTRVFVSHGAGQVYYNLCSAPTPATISSFMSQHLLALGWHQLSNNGWGNGAYQLTIIIANNTNWTLKYTNPDL